MKKGNRTWLVFANNGKFRHADAIKELRFIDWRMSRNFRFSLGDIVYVYMSAEQSVRFKMIVTTENCERADSEYWMDKVPAGKCYRLELLEEYGGTLLCNEELKKHGFLGGRSIEHPCCSNAALLEYISSVFNTELSIRMQEDELFYQAAIQNEPTPTDDNFKDTLTCEPDYYGGTASPVVRRIPRIARQSLAAAGFVCAMDSHHLTFSTGKGTVYMESHHLIPCTYSNAKYFWQTRRLNIDCMSNIVCLCPTCHRKIHFAAPDEKRAMLKQVYEKQRQRLCDAGLNISFEELAKLYSL